MNTKSFALGAVVLSTLVLTGCFSKGTTEESTQEFASASCNEYVKVMRCVADKSGAGEEALAGLNQAIEQWKTLPEEQLNQACDSAMLAITAQKDSYVQLGCDFVLPAGLELPVEETMTGEVMTGDATSGTVVTDPTTDTVDATTEEVLPAATEKTPVDAPAVQ